MTSVWTRMRRSPYQVLAVVMVTALTFFAIAFLGLLTYFSQRALVYFETRPQIIIFLSDKATPAEISNLQNQLSSDARVKDVVYVSKEEALAIYKKSTADNPLLSELVSPDIFPASVEFSVVDLKYASELVSELKGRPIVGQIGYTASVGGASLEEVVTSLRNVTFQVRRLGAGIAGFLVCQALVVLLVVMGMRVSARRDEIEILKLVGATSWQIRWPFLGEGILYVFFGAVIGWIVVAAMALYGLPKLLVYFQNIPVLPGSMKELVIILGAVLGGEVVVAVFLGLVGTLLALWRYSKV